MVNDRKASTGLRREEASRRSQRNPVRTKTKGLYLESSDEEDAPVSDPVVDEANATEDEEEKEARQRKNQVTRSIEKATSTSKKSGARVRQKREELLPILPHESLPRRKQPKPNRPSDWSVDSSDDDYHGSRKKKQVTENGGYLHTMRARARIGKANKGNTPWNKGRHRSDADKQQIRAGVLAANHSKLLAKLEQLGMSEDEYKAQERHLKYQREALRRMKKRSSRKAGQLKPYQVQRLEQVQRDIEETLKALGRYKDSDETTARTRNGDGALETPDVNRRISESMNSRYGNVKKQANKKRKVEVDIPPAPDLVASTAGSAATTPGGDDERRARLLIDNLEKASSESRRKKKTTRNSAKRAEESSDTINAQKQRIAYLEEKLRANNIPF